MESKKLYREIIFVQESPLIDECDGLMAKTIDPYDWEHHGDAVIDYLRQWDMDEWVEDEIVTEKPRIARYDQEYTKDGYTLLYNSTIGGVYLLYRDANEMEIQDYNDNH